DAPPARALPAGTVPDRPRSLVLLRRLSARMDVRGPAARVLRGGIRRRVVRRARSGGGAQAPVGLGQDVPARGVARHAGYHRARPVGPGRRLRAAGERGLAERRGSTPGPLGPGSELPEPAPSLFVRSKTRVQIPTPPG